MEQVLLAKVEEEQVPGMLFEPGDEKVRNYYLQRFSEYQDQPNDGSFFKAQRQLMLYKRVAASDADSDPLSIMKKDILETDLSFMDGSAYTYIKIQFLKLIRGLMIEELEDQKDIPENAKTFALVITLYLPLSEESGFAIDQILTGLAGLSVMDDSLSFLWNQKLSILPIIEDNINNLLDRLESDQQLVMDQLVFCAMALEGILKVYPFETVMTQKVIQLSGQIFSKLSTTACLKKQKSYLELEALAHLCLQMLETTGLKFLDQEPEDEKERKLWKSELKRRKTMLRPLLNWIEKYCSVYGLSGGSLPYAFKNLWLFIHRDSASTVQTEKFLSLYSALYEKYPAVYRFSMGSADLSVAQIPGGLYLPEGQPDLLFQGALLLFRKVAGLENISIYRDIDEITGSVDTLTKTGMISIPLAIFENVLQLFDLGIDPEKAKITVEQIPGEEWKTDPSSEQQMVEEFRTHLFRSYCSSLLGVTDQILDSAYNVQKKSLVQAAGFVVQAGNFLNKLMSDERTRQLNVEELTETARLCYWEGSLLEEMKCSYKARAFFSYAQSVLTQLDEKQGLDERQKMILQEAEYSLMKIARTMEDSKEALNQAARLLDLMGTEKDCAANRDAHEAVVYLDASHELAQAAPSDKAIPFMLSALLPLEKFDQVSKDRTMMETPFVHRTVMMTYRDLITTAYKNQDYEMAVRLSSVMLDHTLRNTVHSQDLGYSEFGLESYVASLYLAGFEKEASQNAIKIVNSISSDEYGSGFYFDPTYYASYCILLNSKKAPKGKIRDFQNGLSRYLMRVPFFTLMEQDVCDVLYLTMHFDGYPEMDWKNLDGMFFNRDLSPSELSLPQPVWQEDYVQYRIHLAEILGFTDLHSLTHGRAAIKRTLKSLEKLEKRFLYKFPESRARLEFLLNYPDIIRSYPDPAVFDLIDSLYEKLHTTEFDQTAFPEMLKFQLASLEAMAAYMQHNLVRLQQSKTTMMDLLDDLPENDLVVFQVNCLTVILMAALRDMQDNGGKQLASLMEEAGHLYSRMKYLHRHINSMILDSLLEMIKLETGKHTLQSFRFMPVVKTINSMQESLRRTLLHFTNEIIR